MKKIQLLLLAVAIVAAVACKPKAKEGWELFNSDVFSISYPTTWTADTHGGMNTAFAVLAPLDSLNDNFQENVNLVIQDLAGQNLTLDSYTDLTVSQINSLMANSNIIDNRRVKDGKMEYQRIIFTANMGELPLRFEQRCFIKRQKAYILTFTTRQDAAESYTALGEEMLNSFVLK